MKKVFKIIGKSVCIFFISLISLVGLVWGGLNIGKFIIYSEYYSIESNLCKNPGLNDGFVCQGITVADAQDKIIVSGYMKDKSASRLYVTDKDNNSYYVSLQRNSKKFTGHAGGVSCSKTNVYIASGDKVYTIPLTTLLNAKNKDVIDIGEGTPVNNQASFSYCDDNYLYVGEFHDGGAYITEHPYQTNDGMFYAIVSKYDVNDITKPIKIYSIRNKVQGICFTPDGKVILSTSYGLADSHYYVYNEADAVNSNLTLDGAPVYYLNNCIRDVKGPAMAEGLDYYQDKIITLTESACDKYIFGKFFFANKIVLLDL
ncbi:MAG: hypothetical protein E7180_06515 [Erysipelotrichaceae bacterium]|nr:hypothetical protein [Erysipelotrichaceae bacterium]